MPVNVFIEPKIPAIGMYRPFPHGEKGAISSNCPDATKAGLEILKQGGNAIDAAVAVSLALGVVEPYHSGVGGGCFTIVYHKATNRFYAYDARGIAAIKATETMFQNPDGSVNQEAANLSADAAVVPGLYRCMDEVLTALGSKTMMEVSMPAIKLCEKGFAAGFQYERLMDTTEAEYHLQKRVDFKNRYLKDGELPKFGDTIYNLPLAETMRAVAEKGVDWFYKGAMSDCIINAVEKENGRLCKEDLAAYKVNVVEPIRGNYKGHEIITMSPPSSGGTHLIQMLNILSHFDIKSMGHHSADHIHLVAEVLKKMYADRSVAMGDPKFMSVDTERIISLEYAKEIADSIDMSKAASFLPNRELEPKDYRGCTSHFSVMDAEGNIVVQTQTVRSWWGCGVVIPEGGFVLNNTMADFSAKAGERTTQGLAYGMANCIEAGKTPLSSMTPTIVLKDGNPFLAVGAAGGPRIISSTLQTILNVIDFGMTVDHAVKVPHISCLSYDQGLELEFGISGDTLSILENRGHKLVNLPANSHFIVLPNGVQCFDHGYIAGGANRGDGGGGILCSNGKMIIDGLCTY